MENSEILKKAIKKAIRGGYIPKLEGLPLEEHYLNKFIELKYYYPIIFSHDFAKAYWGEERTPIDYTNGIPVLNMLADYKWHLQKMIIEKNPVKYIAKFLK